MIPFRAPVDDILFSLCHVAEAGRIDGWDNELAADIAAGFANFAEAAIAPLNAPGDLQGCRLENGRVRMPDGFAAAYAQLAEMGWQGLTAPEAHGGMAQGPLVASMVSEIFSGACHSMQMVCNLVPGAISTLLRFGSDAQQATWLPRLASGQALSTMCLTEAGAGSDLSRVRTRAKQTADGWRITGDKIFISGGDQNLSEDILHLVLARSGDANEGTRGLSLFLTARSQAGSAIKITRIEEKLGLHASPTCQMSFEGAPAELLGREGEGLKAMFTLMNHARLDVALQGVAHAARAHQIAAAYASGRKQGRKADGADAVLSDHVDVQRMLDEQKALALGARSMVHVALVEGLAGHGTLLDFLTPICKVFCTEAGLRSADLGIQILGGYGYLTEYGVSQTWRDARITSIYEGANGIHALTTVTRGLRSPEGPDAFDALIGQLSSDPRVLSVRDRWRSARKAAESASNPAEMAHTFTQLSGRLFFAAVWSKIARVSGDAEHARLAETQLGG